MLLYTQERANIFAMRHKIIPHHHTRNDINARKKKTKNEEEQEEEDTHRGRSDAHTNALENLALSMRLDLAIITREAKLQNIESSQACSKHTSVYCREYEEPHYVLWKSYGDSAILHIHGSIVASIILRVEGYEN